jgi:GNAT superfamily N-acetyltransferase
MSITVRDPRPEDAADFRRLWGDYLVFYSKELDPEISAHTWARILDPGSPVFARIAERDGVFAGFAVCVLHEGTWVKAPICYLEDLFVDQALRGGLGRALIDDLLALATARGWARVYWHTETGNGRARRLYEQYKPADDYVRYTLVVE